MFTLITEVAVQDSESKDLYRRMVTAAKLANVTITKVELHLAGGFSQEENQFTISLSGAEKDVQAITSMWYPDCLEKEEWQEMVALSKMYK